MNFLQVLSDANGKRCIEWTGSEAKDPCFAGLELANEMGELLDVIKKIYRHQQGWKGGIDPKDPKVRQHLEEEFGDVLICLSILARIMDVDLEDSTIRKFNMTSRKHQFRTLIPARRG